jgi:hypothetical protein
MILCCTRVAADNLRLCYECDQLLTGTTATATATLSIPTTTSLPSSLEAATATTAINTIEEEEEDPRHSLDSYMANSNRDSSDVMSPNDEMTGLNTSLDNADTAQFFMAECLAKPETPVNVVRQSARTCIQSQSKVSRSARVCRVCARHFSTDSALAAHLFLEHADYVRASSGEDELLRRFTKCPLDGCHKAFRSDSSAALRNHVQRSHKEEEGGKMAAVADMARSTSSGSNVCLECGKVFKNVHFLRKHTSGKKMSFTVYKHKQVPT